jgi:hypothetical protein
MEIPPALVYLFNRLHFFLLPPIAVYLAINLGKQHLGLSIPTWITVVATLLSRPTLTLFRNRYTDLTDRRAATALGAVLPPHVPESSFAIAKKILTTLEGYPGKHEICLYYLSKYFHLKGISWLGGQKPMDILTVFLNSQVVW